MLTLLHNDDVERMLPFPALPATALGMLLPLIAAQCFCSLACKITRQVFMSHQMLPVLVDLQPSGLEESLLSQTFQRGFAAGEALSVREAAQLLACVLDDFKLRHSGNTEAVRWSTAFASFLRQRIQNRADNLNLAYLAEGAGI